ncbi:uncharacterized protein AB675_4026 [Cyphellophora attinorum]|uniref:Uncharacterized protein n=1 Tax=Cyphellophora attinorum TaxID=1664694 RepID=A0A0N1NZK6_9EURO|nr:uncharacterized protein AB675_4026 [Phialophora attinorum]KPI37512.1 hypothetical protein AB675_4026 [Phialophora attinorum]
MSVRPIYAPIGAGNLSLADFASTPAVFQKVQPPEPSEAAAALRRLLSQQPGTTTAANTSLDDRSTCWENARRNCNQKLQLCLQKVAIIANKLNPFGPPEPLLTDEMAAAVDVAYRDAQATYRRQTEKWEASHEAERKFERRESERQASLRSSSSASDRSGSPEAKSITWATQINCPCTALGTNGRRDGELVTDLKKRKESRNFVSSTKTGVGAKHMPRLWGGDESKRFVSSMKRGVGANYMPHP